MRTIFPYTPPKTYIYVRLNGSFVRPPFRIPRPHMLISSACQGYSFEKVLLPKHHVASYTYQCRMRWRHIVAVASSACQGYSFDKVPLIKHHVISYTHQYRKWWSHDVAVATFLFPYTPPKTYTCQFVNISRALGDKSVVRSRICWSCSTKICWYIHISFLDIRQ